MAAEDEVCNNSVMAGRHTTSNGLNVLSRADELQISEWNRDVPEVVSTCIHSLISSRALSQPDFPAVCSWDGDFTYGELDNLSSTLATYLQTQGVGPEIFVPLCFEKSKWTILSMIAVNKAGGAFVPIDPTQPRNRISHVVGQTGARLALSSQPYAETCKGMVDLNFVVDDNSMETLTKGQQSSSPASAKNAAYCIFTSGSTGAPKGVVVEHEQLSTYSMIGGKALGFDSKPRVLQFASYTFDASLIEIFNTLVYGGCVCVPSDWERMNGIVQAMDRMKVTCAVFSPSLLSNISLDNLETLSTVILGAEKIPTTLIQRLPPRLKVWPTYGPTETCCVCLQVDTSKAIYGVGDIGRAMTARPWIVEVDNVNKLAAIGSVGELLLEGPVVARGYLNDAEKSSKVFIEPPSWMSKHVEDTSYRFYRTGDLAQYNNDGSIKFLGRLDNQVKIRGQRLELGEVEHYLQKSLADRADVKEVVVELVVPWAKTSNPALAAFLRLDPDIVNSFGFLNWEENEPSTLVIPGMEKQRLAKLVSEVKAELAKFLPPYAIPSFYIPIKKVPLSTALKVDRKSLRAMAGEFSAAQLSELSNSSQSMTTSSVDLPLSPTARRLQSLWGQVLGISPSTITTNDNFLWLGGDSVLAIGLVAAARSEGLYVSVGDVLKRPILSDMAASVSLFESESKPEPDISAFMLVEANVVDRLRDSACKQCNMEPDLIEDIYPCSPMQLGLLALSIKESGSYMMQSVFSMSFSLDVEKFKAVWQKIVSSQAILRTRFFQDGTGGLYQVVLKEAIQWQEVKDTSVDSFLAEDKRLHMEIGSPMSRFAILEQSGNGYTFIWTVHHSLIDGWSSAQVLKEVEQVYSNIPSAPVTSYNNFIRYLSTIDSTSSKSFWARQLMDSPTPSFPPLPSPNYRPVGNATLKHQTSMAKQSRSSYTTATIIKAAWQLLVGSYSNTNDVVTGMTLNGRTASLAGIETMVGPTLVTIPFRTQFRRDQRVSDLLQAIQDQYIEMIPFEQLSLAEIKQISADSRAACDFQNLLVVQSTQEMRSQSSGLFSSAYDVHLSLHYALALECELTSHSGSSTKVQLKATYDALLLNEVQIQRFLHQFEHILHQLCIESPTSRVSDILSASPADLQQILSWNASVPNTDENCVHSLIEKRTLMNRNHPAICSWDGDLSYGELDDLSSQLSSYLTARENIGPETLVPVCFEKSKWAVIAMISVLKAGGACVPLSPAHPVKRLKTIIKDLGQSCAGIVLTSQANERLFNGIKPTLSINTSLLSKISTNGLDISTILPSRKVTPNNVAFVITTSGSTGKPKEILLEHAAICTSARDHGKMIKLGSHSRVLQFAAYTFDISLGDMFVTLIHGGCICIPSEHDRMNNLAGAIQSMNVNHASLTTAVATHLHPEDVKSLKILVVAGEAVTREIVDKWADHITLINMYGPAECSIYCIGQPDIRRNDHASIIGRGVGARVWITNEADPNILAPIGTVGELLIEGPVLARGYLCDEAQTKSAFIHDPTWIQRQVSDNASSRRFYRTGDLATYSPEGLISFVGRKDDGQIKLRGQRVEGGEVEYQLRACLSRPAESVVSVIMVNGQAQLAAFVEIESFDDNIKTNGSGPIAIPAQIADSPKQLELFKSLTKGIENKMSALLPGYMVPSLYIPVSKIPLSISGKVDRKKLQRLIAHFSIDQLSGLRQDSIVSAPPSTPMERRLAALWKQLLKIKSVGRDDNFFQRGGDSIGAMRLVAAARQVSLSITVDAIFKNPTLFEMALIIHDDVKEIPEIPPYSLLSTADIEHICEDAISQCKVAKEEIEDIYPCIPQQIYWIDGGINKQEHQAQCVYDVSASLDLDRFRGAWNAVAYAHPILRTRIINTPSGYCNIVLKTGLQWRTEASLEAYLKEDRAAIMGFGERLQRFCIVNDDYLGKQFFVFTAQHSSYDAWSLYLLTKDRDHAYHHGVSAAAGPNFNQYIKPLIQDSYKNAASTFWKAHLAGTKTTPLIVVPEGHHVFPDSMMKRDFKLSKPAGSRVTTSTMIEVGWAIVFSKAMKEQDVVLDILRHGRNAPLPGVMDLIAPTMAAVPFLIRVKPEEKTRSLLLTVQAQLANIDSFEHMGFDNIAKLNPEVAMACRNSVRIHILPPLSDLQKDGGIVKGIDLPTRWVELCLALPLRIDLVVTRDGIGIEANFDKDLISADQVNDFFDQFQSVMLQLAAADDDQKIKDITLSGISDHNSVLMESIAAKSGEVKKALLTPQPPSSKPLTGSFVIGRW